MIERTLKHSTPFAPPPQPSPTRGEGGWGVGSKLGLDRKDDTFNVPEHLGIPETEHPKSVLLDASSPCSFLG